MSYDTYRVLLVENDLQEAALLLRLLTRESPGTFEISHVDSLARAIEFLAVDTVDVIMLDLNLEDSAGIGTFDGIHADSPEIPIVILSGMLDEDVALQSLKNGAQDYLVKGRCDGHVIVRSLRYAIERKRSELELQKMQCQISQQHRMESLGVLASGIAHEINTPAQFVSANLEFLVKAFDSMAGILQKCERLIDAGIVSEEGRNAFDNLALALRQESYKYFKAEMKQTIAESLDGMDRIRTLVRSMKAFSPCGNSNFIEYDVNQIIRDAVNLSRNEWKYVARMNVELSESLPRCACCPQELCQAFLNIVINAVHAIADRHESTPGDNVRGDIGIHSCQSGNAIEIHITDNGIGIPEDIRDRIFEPFFTTKAIGKGSGQGLGLAYGIIVNKHSGKISFVSNPEQGTVFTISLPVNSNAQKSSTAAVA